MSRVYFEAPYHEEELTLPPKFQEYLIQKDFVKLDQLYQQSLAHNGFLSQYLKKFCDFNTLEGIINIRSAPLDEEGIWHDDGSRILAFSLSLNLLPELISGGELLLRERFIYKDNEDTGATVFRPRPYGRILLFKTGSHDFEHRVTRVTKGTRVVLAGWCS